MKKLSFFATSTSTKLDSNWKITTVSLITPHRNFVETMMDLVCFLLEAYGALPCYLMILTGRQTVSKMLILKTCSLYDRIEIMKLSVKICAEQRKPVQESVLISRLFEVAFKVTFFLDSKTVKTRNT